MDTNMAYALMYIEINLIAVILVGLIRFKSNGLSKMVAQKNFVMAIDALIAFFLSDTLFVMIKCGLFPYSKTAVIASKEIYFFSTALMCWFWFIYFECMQDSPFIKNRKRVRISSALVWIMTALLIVNIFTGILFYVDKHGNYNRGPLFIVQYILPYTYVFVTCFRAFLGIFKKHNIAHRRMLVMLALFPIAPAGAGILQFIYPELPLACAALSIATLVLYLDWVDRMISVDPLTHLNNRKQLAYYFEQWQQDDDENKKPPYLVIADANKFKSINDTYGHLQGDAALLRIANAMRLGCHELGRKHNIVRYGGDEFVILVWAGSSENVKKLCESISRNLTVLNEEAKAPYELTVSFGVAKANDDLTLEELIGLADEELYEIKRALR
ncbi:MAG: GGDEF domain-containing protein [Ruminococcus sp.]|nr:GGDEF domain-containing protein [Ruminococcus sp.]